MCGIAGIVEWGVPAATQKALLSGMLQAISERGPDGFGQDFAGSCALAHARLSLLDLAGGSQPFKSPCGRYTLTYNGQVYNLDELRRELSPVWRFTTRCDTEVVLAAYVSWGKNCLSRLNGMFSFFVWDSFLEKGFAARDRLGVKPFVFAYADGTFVFASEAKAVLRGLKTRPAANLDALLEYFVCPYFSGVDETMFQSVHCLQPGHWLEICREHLRISPWWDWYSSDHWPDEPWLADKLQSVLQASVRRTVQADHPVGLFLSGGVDSTAIGALAASCGKRPHSFTIQYAAQENYDYGQSLIVISDDRPWAQLAADHMHTTLDVVPIDSPPQLAVLRDLARINDLLPAWEQEISQYHLARAAKQVVKAVLVGDAADETHFGYHFLLDRLAVASPANIIRRFGMPPIKRAALPDPVGHFAAKYRMLVAEAGYSFDQPEHQVAATTYLIVKRWLPRLLHNGDIHAMHASLEARVPFADTELLDLARLVPPAAGLRNGQEKALLRQCLTGIIPETIRLRRKSALPKDQSSGRVYQDEVSRLCAEHRASLESFFDMAALQRLCARQAQPSEMERALLFRIIVFCYWLEHYDVRI